MLYTPESESQWEGALLWQAWSFYQKEPKRAGGGERMALQTGTGGLNVLLSECLAVNY